MTQIKFSFEVFPPKTDAGLATLSSTVQQLQRVPPVYISVTYGAGGSSQDKSFAAIDAVAAAAPIAEVAAHLTCVGQSVAEIDDVLDRYTELGVDRIVALRGDPPDGIDAPYRAHPDGFQRTEDLVAAVAARGRFWIAVSAYPEVHPQSPSLEHDIEVLGAKVDAGADAAMTQMFFDNDHYFAYLERVRGAGIEIPIIPGIFPIHSFNGVNGFATRCGATMPTWIGERFAAAADASDPERATFDTAVQIAADQILELAAAGVTQVHLYTLNRPELALAVCDAVTTQTDHTEMAPR